jgi:hypothetical protein
MNIKLTDNDIKTIWDGALDEAITHVSLWKFEHAVLLAQRRKIREWGDSPCPHDHLTNPNRPKHACGECWKELE